MPDEIGMELRGRGILRQHDPHQRMASGGMPHGWRGLQSYLKDPAIKSALKLRYGFSAAAQVRSSLKSPGQARRRDHVQDDQNGRNLF
jgi:hypothetical protein